MCSAPPPNAADLKAYNRREMTLGIVLAGGRGTRLGQDKASFILGGRSMLDRVVDALGRAVDQVIVAKAHGQELPRVPMDVRVVEDVRPGLGPVGGLHAALSSTDGDRAVVVGCDMPFLDPSLLTWLLALDDPRDAVAPMLDGRTQTLHAVYRRACLPALKTLLELGRPSLRDLLRMVDVRYLEGGELGDLERWRRSCAGVNTPEDAARAERLLIGS